MFAMSIASLSFLLQAILISASRECAVQICEHDCSCQNITCDENIIRINCSVDHVALNQTLAVSNVKEISLEGSSNFTTITCSLGSGIELKNVSKVYISNIHFMNCGAQHQYEKTFSSAIFIYGSENIRFEDCSISKSDGIGLFMINNLKVHIIRTNFTYNARTNITNNNYSSETIGAGGGIYLEMTCIPADMDYCKYGEVLINGSYFIGNRAEILRHNGSCVSRLGNGGGLSLLFHGATSSNNVSVANSHFIGNSANFGGGFYTAFCSNNDGEVRNNSIHIQNTLFECNKVTNFSGGGLDMGLIGSGVSNNRIELNGVNISNNTAVSGGGTSIFRISSIGQEDNAIVFKNVKWSSNVAHFGSAVLLSPTLDTKTKGPHMITIFMVLWH